MFCHCKVDKNASSHDRKVVYSLITVQFLTSRPMLREVLILLAGRSATAHGGRPPETDNDVRGRARLASERGAARRGCAEGFGTRSHIASSWVAGGSTATALRRFLGTFGP